MREKVMRVRRIASCKLSLVLTCAGSNYHLGWAWTVSTTIRFTYIPLNVSTWTWLWNKTTRNSFVISQLLLHNVNGIWLDPIFCCQQGKMKKSSCCTYAVVLCISPWQQIANTAWNNTERGGKISNNWSIHKIKKVMCQPQKSLLVCHPPSSSAAVGALPPPQMNAVVACVGGEGVNSSKFAQDCISNLDCIQNSNPCSTIIFAF